MTLDDIKKLIASDESRTLELKKTTGELKDGMHSACAFLNTEGGWLIFGVAPKSLKIIGQEVTDNTQREIAQALAGIDPAVDVHIEYVDVPDYPGNKIIAMHFDGWVWGERPHTFMVVLITKSKVQRKSCRTICMMSVFVRINPNCIPGRDKRQIVSLLQI